MTDFRCIIPLVAFMIALVHKGQGMAIDEMIVDAANSSQEFEFFYDDTSGMLKVEYDILMSYDEYNQLRHEGEEDETGNRKKRTTAMKVRPYYSGRWTNNIVYYQYVASFSGNELMQVNEAIQTWERYTCLNFVQSSTADNRIRIINGGGCYSRLGMSGGTQPLSLAGGCRRKSIIIHEFGHALGLFHEQTKPDRDRFVNIIRGNIAPDMFYNFKKNTRENVDDFDLPYDYMSIMHYGKTAFSVNGQITIRTTDAAYQNLIGQATTLSFLDVKTVNKMYNCQRHTPGCTKTDDDCPGTGFVGKDCTCWCRGDMNNRQDSDPVRPCAPTPTRRPATPRPTARPTPRPTARPTPRPTPRPTRRPVTPRPTPRPTACQDRHRSCSYWSAHGECNANPAYMHVFCKRSCNRCGGGGGGTTCVDTHEACPKWRRMNYCNVRYPEIVRPRCRKSCGLCTASPGDTNTVTTGNGANCRDRNSLCSTWARRGECQRNPAYMLTSCKRSCNQCNNGHHPGTGNSSQQRRCRDLHTNCRQWAAHRYCIYNRGYMHRMCRASCQLSC